MAVTTPPHARVRIPAPPAPGRGAVPDRRLGVLAIVVSATAMGAAGVFGRLASPSGAVIGEALTFGRMLVGALGVLAILACGRRLSVVRRTRLSWSVVVGGVALGLSLATLLSAAVLIDLSLAVALHYLGPVVAVVGARALRGERAGRVEVAALATSVVGMLLISGVVGRTPAEATRDRTTGVVLATVSGVLYGVALLSYRYRADVPADVRSLGNFAFGALGTGALVAVTRPDLTGMTATHWAWAAVLFVVCGLLALGLLVVAGKHLQSTELSGLSFGELVVAMMLGAAVFGEQITALAAAGAVLVVVGAILPLTACSRAPQASTTSPTVGRIDREEALTSANAPDLPGCCVSSFVGQQPSIMCQVPSSSSS